MQDYFNSKYGMARVKEPKYVLPTSAWRIDNNREILDNEMRVVVKKIHIETTNFRQILLEANDDDEKIKEKIADIVIKRGKLHNPVTDTGGVLYGRVEKIGEKYDNRLGLKEGDEIICTASLTTVPLYIDRITEIDRAYSQIDVEGYAILFDKIPLIKKPDNVPINLFLFMLDESGTLFTVAQNAKAKKNFLVVGNNIMLNLIYGCAIRRVAGDDAKIVCLLDKRMNIYAKGEGLDIFLGKVFSEIHYVNILRPMECIKGFGQDSLFDLSINCADIPGAETINILATKDGGTVVFANLINNYNIALYITEATSKQLKIRCAEGYIEGYQEFDLELATELSEYFERIEFTTTVDTNAQRYSSTKERKLLDNMVRINSMAEDFICESRAMKAVLEEVTAVSKYDCNVFISGPTGVGKEKVANVIQKNSTRKMQPFIKINCAAISPNLIESEFFGYEKGSFTGANLTGKKGYFELADGGTIFLDEVGELQLDIQAKLLRVIQDGEFFRVGGTSPVKTNVRILSATNRDLEKMVEEKLFRRDLYYRLNVFPIRIPSLAERKADIPALIRYFVSKYSQSYGVNRDISDDAIEYLMNRNWKGNIRELENVVQRLLINAKGETILLYDVTKELNQELFGGSGIGTDISYIDDMDEDKLNLVQLVEDYEKSIIKFALEKYGSTRKAARAIGISQTQLVRKKNKYSIGEEKGE